MDGSVGSLLNCSRPPVRRPRQLSSRPCWATLSATPRFKNRPRYIITCLKPRLVSWNGEPRSLQGNPAPGMSPNACAALIYLPDGAGVPVETSEDRSPTPSALRHDAGNDSPNSLVVKRPSMSRAQGRPGYCNHAIPEPQGAPCPASDHSFSYHGVCTHLHYQSPLDRLVAATLDPRWSQRLDAADSQYRIFLGLCLLAWSGLLHRRRDM